MWLSMTKLGLLALASTAFAVPETSTLWPRTDGQRYAADDASVALCMVGHIRTMFHPATMGAHFAAFEHLTNLERFAVLSMSSDFHALTEADKSIKTRGAFDTLHAAGLRRYNFTSVYVMDDNHTFTSEFFRTGNCKEGGSCAGLERKVCRKGCASFSMIPLCDEAYMKSRASARETPENWAEQTWKIAQCSRIISSREKRRGKKFEFIIKSRPDFVSMGRFPTLAIFNRPQFFMSWQQDHWNLCPRELCYAGLMAPALKQLSCEAGIDFGYKQKATLDFAGLGKSAIGEMSTRYVIFRDRVHFNNPNTLTAVDCNFWQPNIRAQCNSFVNLADRSGWNATLEWSKEGSPEDYFDAAFKLIRELPPELRRVPDDAKLLPAVAQRKKSL